MGGRVEDKVIRKLQMHEREVQKILGPQKYKHRKRLFQENKFVLLDENQQAIGDNDTAMRKFLTFFKLQEKEHFGGRVLIAESSITNEGKEWDKDGQSFIRPAQLSVVADSAEVEILIMEKNQMPLFPEDVQMEIVAELRRAPNVERPFSDESMASQEVNFDKWAIQKRTTVQKALNKHLPGDFRTELERQKDQKSQDSMFRFVLEEGANAQI